MLAPAFSARARAEYTLTVDVNISGGCTCCNTYGCNSSSPVNIAKSLNTGGLDRNTCNTAASYVRSVNCKRYVYCWFYGCNVSQTDTISCSINASCSGSDSGGLFGNQNGFGQFNAFGAEGGFADFSTHYSNDFTDWSNDARARWASYLQRNALDKEAGITIWPNGAFGGYLEKFYDFLGGRTKSGTQAAGTPITQPLTGDPTPAETGYGNDQLANATVQLLRDDSPTAVAASEVPAVNGANNECVGGMCTPSGSISPAYLMHYNSVAGGFSETTGLKLENLPDGRVVFTDEDNVRWSFRPYGLFNPAAEIDLYYRTPLGCTYRVIYGKLPTAGLTPDGKGFRVETADGKLYELVRGKDGAWRPARLDSPDSSFLAYAYNEAGRVSGITDVHGRTVTLDYNKEGRTAAVTGHSGRRVEFTYDTAGNPLEVTAAGGVHTVYTYNAAGQMATRKTGGLAKELFTYDAQGRLFTEGFEGGVNAAAHYYNDAASKTVITDPLGGETVSEYKVTDGRKLLSRRMDALGAVTEFAYDGNYNLTAATDALHHATRYERNNNGDPVSITDALGNTVQIEYQVKRRYTDGGGDKADYYQRPVKITDAKGGVSTLSYDALGNVTSLRDALGNKISMEYDALGHVVKVSGPGGTTRSEYDKYGALARTTDALGRSVNYERNEDGLPVVIMDAQGARTTLEYDTLQNAVSVTDGAGLATRFAYGDGAGGPGTRLLSLTDPLGHAYSFAYDAYGRLARTANPLSQEKTYDYDKASRLTSARDAAGRSVTYEYDKLGRLTARRSGGSVYSYTYDAAGNMLAASDGASEVAFAYDALNRVAVTTQTVAGRPYAITYTYDASGNRTGMGTPWGAYSYTYDALNRVTDIVNPQGTRINFKYDAAGRRQAKSIYRAGAAVPLNATAYAYDAAGQVTGIVSRAGGVEVAFASYTYNAGGNRVLMTDHDGRHLYGYDKAGRLTDVENYGAPGETFAYDAAGNRASDDRAADYVYDAANRVQTNSLYAYTHDANGNLISRIEKASNAQTTYTYDAWQHLTQAVTPAHKLQYSYDALGRRTTRMVDGATVYYVYDGDDIIAELDADGKLINVYTNGPGIDEPLVMTKPGTGSFYYHADALGSIKAITDDNNVQVETYRYKAYGEPALTNALGQALERSCIGNLRMYTAREYEPELTLYNNRHRYLDPTRGAFTQEDPILFEGRDSNVYRYGLNNPIQYSDPSGTVLPIAVYPILIYTLWDAALSSTYTQTPDGGILTIPPPILWKTHLPGLWGAQVTFKTHEYKGWLINVPVDMSFLVPRPDCSKNNS